MTKFLLFLLTLIFLLAIAFSPVWEKQAFAQPASIPKLTYSTGGQQVFAPDWSNITWSTLPSTQNSGQIELSQDLIKQLGYDPSRTWSAGQTPDQYVMLGDVQDAFHLEAYSLKDISDLTGLAMQSVNLNDFGLNRWQTPSSLVKAIPDLGQLNLSQVRPLEDLAMKNGYVNSDETISELLQQNPEFANAQLGQLDLKQYSLSSIPGLTQTAIGNFKGWQQSFITGVPGLNQVSFSQFPFSLLSGGITLATTDLIWSDAEHGNPEVESSFFISGTVDEKDKTVPVPCESGKPCSYIELSDPVGLNGPYYGKRWASGLIQKVKGGYGPLAIVNGGWEPTGKLVFGSAFKVVLTSVDESKGTADFALYLRACGHFPFIGKSCTPYFIGGIPWFSTSEKGFVVVASTSKPDVNVPQQYRERIAQVESQNAAQESPSPATKPVQNFPNESSGLPARIASAAEDSYGMDTSKIPDTDGGKEACAGAVNSVLNKAGVQSLGGDCSLAVDCIESDLQSGRGEQITDRSQAKAGDIALIPGSHVGICENDGCTQILSNSSSRRAFVWRSDEYMSPSYGELTKVYRVKN